MSLASYVINFNEIEQYITDAIKQCKLKFDPKNLDFDESEVDFDITQIQDYLDSIKKMLQYSPDLLINMGNKLQSISDNLTNIKQGLDTEQNSLETNLKNIFQAINAIAELLTNTSSDNSIDKIYGKKLMLFAGNTNGFGYIELPIETDNTVISSVTISSSAFADGDKWEFIIKDGSNYNTIINDCYIKPFDETKTFKKPIICSNGTVLQVKIYNGSNTTKTFFVDFHLQENYDSLNTN